MNSTDVVTELFSNTRDANREPKTGGSPGYPIRVKALAERDRRRLMRHFLALPPADRQLRFGSQIPDEVVTRYVQNIDVRRDMVFGVYDPEFRLIGVGHLAFAPRDSNLVYGEATTREQVAEFGVSVSAEARGLGIGTRLFQRAAMHCRNAEVDTLYMHCLSANHTMMHIARKAGMEIHRAHGEADAYLKLAPADAGSMLQEAVDEQMASFDYTVKANMRAASKWLKSWSDTPADLSTGDTGKCPDAGNTSDKR